MATRPSWIYDGTGEYSPVPQRTGYFRVSLILAGAAILLATFVIAVSGAYVLGRAIDTETASHVLITRNGVTLDCERITDVAGNVFYDSCVRVP